MKVFRFLCCIIHGIETKKKMERFESPAMRNSHQLFNKWKKKWRNYCCAEITIGKGKPEFPYNTNACWIRCGKGKLNPNRKRNRNQWHRHISKISYLLFFHNTNDIFSVPKPNTSLKYSHFKLTTRTTTITTTSLSNRSHSRFKHNVDGLFPRGNVSTPCLIVKYFRWAMHCHPFRSWICRRIYRLLATYTAVLSMCVRMWTMTRTLSYCCSWTGLMWVLAVILIP